MTIELTQEQEEVVEQALTTGHFSDRGQVIAEALTLLKRRDEARAALRADVQRGLDDLDAGHSRTVGTPEEAQALAADLKQRAGELGARRRETP